MVLPDILSAVSNKSYFYISMVLIDVLYNIVIVVCCCQIPRVLSTYSVSIFLCWCQISYVWCQITLISIFLCFYGVDRCPYLPTLLLDTLHSVNYTYLSLYASMLLSHILCSFHQHCLYLSALLTCIMWSVFPSRKYAIKNSYHCIVSSYLVQKIVM